MSSLTASLLGRLPSTNCQVCLAVRSFLEKRFSGAVTTQPPLVGCLEEPIVTGKDLVQWREALQMTQQQFAKKFGITLEHLKGLEVSKGDVGAAINLLDPSAYFGPTSKVVSSAGIGKGQPGQLIPA